MWQPPALGLPPRIAVSLDHKVVYAASKAGIPALLMAAQRPREQVGELHVVHVMHRWGSCMWCM